MGDVVVAGAISKGVIHVKVDAVVNHTDGAGKFDRREGFLQALRQAVAPTDYGTLLETQAGALRAETTYLRDVFYTTPNGWGADGGSVFAILRLGLIRAIEEAGSTRLLDSYWLAASEKVVETIICRSPIQVTRIFLTPPIPMTPENSRKRHTDAPMWVVTPQGAPSEREGFERNDAIVRAVEGNTVTWQRREFP
jgi:hypothetical protein